MNQDNENKIAQVVVDELDRIDADDPRAGKDWTIQKAKEHGMSDADIETYILGL